MLVASGEDDGAGLVPDEALGDAGVAQGRAGEHGIRRRPVGPGVDRHAPGADHLHGQGVAVRPGLEAIDLGEDRLPLLHHQWGRGRRAAGGGGALRRRRRCLAGHVAGTRGESDDLGGEMEGEGGGEGGGR